MRNNSLNEALRHREEQQRQRQMTEVAHGGHKVPALDDTQRVKVLSPGRLVSKRFFRNKLALVGLGILIFMFAFAFLGPLFYSYSQTQIFYKYDYLNIDYASATERTENVAYTLGDAADVSSRVKNSLNSYISTMESEGQVQSVITDEDGAQYALDKLGDHVYTLSADALTEFALYSESAVVGDYDRITKSITWRGDPIEDTGFTDAVADAVADESEDFSFGGVSYSVKMVTKNSYTVLRASPTLTWTGEALDSSLLALVQSHLDGTTFTFDGMNCRVRTNTDGTRSVCRVGDKTPVYVLSTYVFNAYDTSAVFSDAFKAEALLAIYGGGSFTADGAAYTLAPEGDGFVVTDAAGTKIASLGTFVVRRYSGEDSLSMDFKELTQQTIADMQTANAASASFTYSLPEMDAEGNYLTDENGNPVYANTEIVVTKKSTMYVLNCEQITYLIDIYSPPSASHFFGTDGDGMDILARMMYGGRISLMVGFVVVLLETFLGVILGGLAGFFGGWVDTLIMRLVDIFYCIPSLPILIIMGAYFDAIKMDPYQRLIWLMAILGILGWAAVARLVRGQILSLREQEFMVAEEATGIRANRRIFRHLIPNVMPQLIVNATMGLGSVIITESTLSFLGLGVKHPLATWGTMINSVTKSSESMIKYTYIWVPVGLLICLTVIAFNFVGDGLRDAFDPKMKQ